MIPFRNSLFYFVKRHFWAAAAAGASVHFQVESKKNCIWCFSRLPSHFFLLIFGVPSRGKMDWQQAGKDTDRIAEAKYWQNNDKVWLFLDAKIHSWVNSLNFYLYDKHFYRYGLKYGIFFNLYDKHLDRYGPIKTARKVPVYDSPRSYAETRSGRKILLFHLPLFCCLLLSRSGLSDLLLPYLNTSSVFSLYRHH